MRMRELHGPASTVSRVALHRCGLLSTRLQLRYLAARCMGSPTSRRLEALNLGPCGDKRETRAMTVAERIVAARYGLRSQFAQFTYRPGAIVVEEPGAVGYLAVVWDPSKYDAHPEEDLIGNDAGFPIHQLRY